MATHMRVVSEMDYQLLQEVKAAKKPSPIQSATQSQAGGKMKDKKNFVINGLKIANNKLLWLAWKLLSVFLDSKLLDWTNTGTIIYNGEPIENSDIVKLMRCLLEKNKEMRTLPGIQEFLKSVLHNHMARKLLNKTQEKFLVRFFKIQ
jgi:hypothetical protein